MENREFKVVEIPDLCRICKAFKTMKPTVLRRHEIDCKRKHEMLFGRMENGRRVLYLEDRQAKAPPTVTLAGDDPNNCGAADFDKILNYIDGVGPKPKTKKPPVVKERGEGKQGNKKRNRKKKSTDDSDVMKQSVDPMNPDLVLERISSGDVMKQSVDPMNPDLVLERISSDVPSGSGVPSMDVDDKKEWEANPRFFAVPDSELKLSSGLDNWEDNNEPGFPKSPSEFPEDDECLDESEPAKDASSETLEEDDSSDDSDDEDIVMSKRTYKSIIAGMERDCQESRRELAEALEERCEIKVKEMMTGFEEEKRIMERYFSNFFNKSGMTGDDCGSRLFAPDVIALGEREIDVSKQEIQLGKLAKDLEIWENELYKKELNFCEQKKSVDKFRAALGDQERRLEQRQLDLKEKELYMADSKNKVERHHNFVRLELNERERDLVAREMEFNKGELAYVERQKASRDHQAKIARDMVASRREALRLWGESAHKDHMVLELEKQVAEREAEVLRLRTQLLDLETRM